VGPALSSGRALHRLGAREVQPGEDSLAARMRQMSVGKCRWIMMKMEKGIEEITYLETL
jgi:hypothetical protein